ncbi:MAG: DEAD/DEAH box helicase [Desulfurivibrio sp.]|nr:DEAD/DEAH box helicase [Desulfurivibrio sp.]
MLVSANPESNQQYQRIIESMRLAVSHHDQDGLQQAILAWFDLKERGDYPDPLLELLDTPFDPEALALLPPPIKLYALNLIFQERIKRLADLSPQLAFLEQPTARANVPARFHPPFTYLQLVGLLLQGRLAEATAILDRQSSQLAGFGLAGWLLFLAGEDDAAVASFSTDLEILRQRENSARAYFTGLEGLLFLLAQLAADNYRYLSQIKAIIADLEDGQPHNFLLPAYRLCKTVPAILENQAGADRRLLDNTPPPDDGVTLLVSGLLRRWRGGGMPHSLQANIQTAARRAWENHHCWLAAGLDELLPTYEEGAERCHPWRSLNHLILPREPWHHALQTLEQAEADPAGATEAEPHRRLAWLLHYLPREQSCRLRPVVQHRRRNGWSKGRPLALRRLLSPEQLLNGPRPIRLDHRDRALGNAIERESGPGGERYYLSPRLDLSLLEDHPRLFLATNPGVRVRLESQRPALLLVKEDSQHWRLSLAPFPESGNQVLIRCGEADFQLFTFNEQLQQLASRLGPAGQRQPLATADSLLAQLGELPTGLNIFSEHAGLPLEATEETADPQPVLQLMPAGQGLRLRPRVRPLGADGPCLPPGRGYAAIWVTAAPHNRHVRRDLAAERTAVHELAARCGLEPPQAGTEEQPEDDSWRLHDPRHCLELLEQLRRKLPATRLEWPEGEGFSLSPTAGLGQLQLKINHHQDWFSLDGSLRLDDGLVLELDSLLRATERDHSRFIPLGNGRFLSLSDSLRRKLDELAALAELRHGRVTLHPLAARLLFGPDDGEQQQDPAAGDAAAPQLSGDAAWHDFLDRLRRLDQWQPEVPAGLKTTLRPYQLEGYHWLRQLAELGFGACLADDMGLGKTIQALALLLSRAAAGPSLVIAPTSVCRNWQQEAARFAPELRVIAYAGPRRRHLLQELGPRDLVIGSYSLLQRDAEALAAPYWQTIILDEAQAIKNFLAKRSRAAMRLQGGCKVITTGTPLENHLAELWTLFRFINPGLLGNLERFNRRFAAPIEQHRDPQARHHLRQLLTPFVLRRLKGEVLQELPPRTDITLQVELSREEASLYEALRRQSLNSLEQEESRHRTPLRILREIMRLRRVCCHPRLVLPESELPGAKHELFLKVVTELLENHHRILVFSQFVDHLALIRELLDARDIGYQYLDGATPAAVRQRRVEDFQNGREDLFLISLRAGGLGLNLTGADYVIHLDPWWNPAVEEQASDRAHRIGQDRPVTVYRLITSSTIEEKILALHQHKRDLAGDLLNHNRQGPPRSSTELLALLE